MTDKKRVGGCMCGAIRYAADHDAMFTALCHCHMCQQWAGSPMLGTVAFKKAGVTFTKGTPKLYRSSSVCDRGFCADCGSSLFTRYDSGGAFDDLIFIGLGTLDDPNVAKPSVHYGAEGEIPWMHHDDGVPRLRIDVDDPAAQNALFEKMLAAAGHQA